MNNKINLSDFFLLVWLVFSVVMVVIPHGTSIIRSILFYLSIGSLFLMFVYSIKACHFTKTFRVLNAFVVVLLIYGTILWISGDTILVQESGAFASGRAYVQTIMFSLFPIYAGYAFTEFKMCSGKKMAIWAILFLIANIVVFFFNRAEMLFIAQSDDITNNAGYLIAASIPTLILFRKRIVLQSILLVICAILVIFGMKRGATLVSGLCIMYIIWQNINNKTSKKIPILFLSAIVLYGIYYYFGLLLQTNDYFSSRIMLMIEGDAQNRDIITEQILDYLSNQTSIIKWILGSGAYTTIKYFYNYAHNDWLEIIVCQGLFGVSLYLAFYYNLAKDCIRQEDNGLKQALSLIFIYLFVRTFFSMSYGDIPFFLSFFIGYCFSKVHQSEPLIDD